MSDEEDSLSEPGVWVARPPRFRAAPLTQLCYRLDANSKHGTKANRMYGPPSDRLPSAEAQLLPLHLYNPHFQEEEARAGTPPHPPGQKGYCPDLSSFVEIKVEKDEWVKMAAPIYYGSRREGKKLTQRGVFTIRWAQLLPLLKLRREASCLPNGFYGNRQHFIGTL